MSDIDKLRAFANDVMSVWPDGDLGGDQLQDFAITHGLLALEIRYESCAVEYKSRCQCSEYLTDSEFQAGVECYRKTALLKGDAA